MAQSLFNRSRPTADIVELAPPSHLSSRAKKYFRGWAQHLFERGTSTILDAAGLSEMAQIQAEIDELRAIVKKNGYTYVCTTRDGGTMVRSRPEVAMLADASRRLAMLCKEYQLTPAARMKAGA